MKCVAPELSSLAWIEVQRVRASVRRRMFGRAEDVLVGRYQVLGAVGRGGMGLVYEAYDPQLHRRVAIKLAHADLLGEARALARLDSADVVQVLDVGTHEGRTYLVMPLMDGDDLATWLHSPRTPAEILDAFGAAGRGLADVHRAGLLHCDFKPANVLVAGDGGVRLADFGLARPIGDRPHRPAGTPRYMAPEVLAGGPLDARTDEYCFCLALRRALPARIPRSLHAVLARGLAADPEDRWPDLPALLAAIARARRPRARWFVGAAAVLALAAGIAPQIASAPPTAQLDVRPWTASLPTTAAYRLAEQHDRAGDYADAVDVLTAAIAGATAAGNDAMVARASTLLAFVEGVRRVRPDAAAEAIRHAEAALDRNGEADLDLRAFFDRTQGALALLDQDAARAKACFARALEPFADADGPDRVHAASAHNGLGRVAVAENDLEAAATHFERAHALWNAELGPGHPRTSMALVNLGATLDQAGRYEDARTTYVRALEGVDDGPLRTTIEINLGNTLLRMGQYAAAREHLEARVSRLDGSDNALLGNALTGLGNIAMFEARYADAYRRHVQAIVAFEAAYGPDHLQTAVAFSNAGEVSLRQGALDNAARWLERALEIRRARLDDGHPLLAFPLTALGKVRLAQGDVDAALTLLTEALSVREANDADAPRFRAETRFALARAQWAAGSRAVARRLATEARAELGPTPTTADDARDIERWLQSHPIRDEA